MKNNYKWMFLPLAAAVFSITGCNASIEKPDPSALQEETKEVNTAAPMDIKSGVNDVLAEVKKLEQYVKAATPNPSEINKYGKAIAAKWDAFEDEVEDTYPKQYEEIESNLYPLIAETGKQKLDLQKIQELTQKVQQDLMMFLKQLQ
ncbi:MAG: hypothetical protein ACE3JP_16005 [Ectobacillus sp.]